MWNSVKKENINMLSFNKLSKQNKNFSRLTGVKIEEFREIV